MINCRSINLAFLMTLLIPLCVLQLHAKELKREPVGIFNGRVVKINREVNIIRVRADFSNFRYLNKRDKVRFWHENNESSQCEGLVLGKSAKYFTIRVPALRKCANSVLLSPGWILTFFSQDLVNNIRMGTELLSILTEKRRALYGRMQKNKKDIETYIERMDAVNKRYEVLKEKMEFERKREVAALEEDQVILLHTYKELENKVFEVDQKMHAYRIEDDNFNQDRWALDRRLYYKK